MSIDVMKAVWEHSQHAETDLVVMLALADMANSDGYCFPSIPTLAQRARRQVRSMINTLDRISTSGELFVDRSRGRNHHNRYVITIGMTKEKLAHVLVRYMDYDPTAAVNASIAHFEKHAVGCENMQPTALLQRAENMQPTTQNMQPTAPLNMQPTALKHAAHCTRSIIEPSIETKEEPQPVDPPPPVVTTADPWMDAAKRKWQTGKSAPTQSWQAELNLELEAKRRVPLAAELARVSGWEALIDAGDDKKNEECHRAAIFLYKMGVATPGDLKNWYADYLSDTWARDKNPNPRPEKVKELVSKKAAAKTMPVVRATNGNTASYRAAPSDLFGMEQ
jgi:hypothetical protein